MKTKVALFRRRSVEHDISVSSAKAVVEQIDSEKYHVIPIAIGQDGKWLSPSESLENFLQIPAQPM